MPSIPGGEGPFTAAGLPIHQGGTCSVAQQLVTNVILAKFSQFVPLVIEEADKCDGVIRAAGRLLLS